MPSFTIIEGLFGLCCLILNEWGVMFGLSYQATSVILCCFVEPLFMAVLLTLAILALCGVPVQRVSRIFFWTVIAVLGILTLVALGRLFDYFLHIPLDSMGSYRIMETGETNPFILGLFSRTKAWLEGAAARFHTSYFAVNIAVYVILMPVVSLVSYLISTRKPVRK